MINKTGDTAPIIYSSDLIQKVDKYIELRTVKKKDVTLDGFSNSVNISVETLIAWSEKKVKGKDGKLTEELARPEFFKAIQKLQGKVEELKKEEKPKEEKLNPQQELFCQYYATDREFFGNGVQSYIEAYGINLNKPGAYQVAQASASRLLSNVIICKRINELLSDEGLNDAFVDKQLLFVIAQHDDKSSKVAAIREYNKLKQRIIDRIDHTTKGKEMPSPIYGGKARKSTA